MNCRRLAWPNFRRMNDADPVFHVQPPHIAHTQVITVRHRHTNLGGRRAGAQLEPAKIILQLVLTFERFRGRDLGELQQPARSDSNSGRLAVNVWVMVAFESSRPFYC